MAVSISRMTDEGADIEVIAKGEIDIGFIPSEFFGDTFGDSAQSHQWLEWIESNSKDVEKTIIAKTSGGFINKRFDRFQSRGKK